MQLEVALQSRCMHEEQKNEPGAVTATCKKLSVAVLAAGLLVAPGLTQLYIIQQHLTPGMYIAQALFAAAAPSIAAGNTSMIDQIHFYQVKARQYS